MATHYETLGIPPGSDIEAVKTAWRGLAKKHHPDRNPGDQSAKKRFIAVKEAYDVLGDDQKKAAYDLNLSLGGGQGPFNPFDSPFRTGVAAGIYEELFRDFVGAGGPFANHRRRRQPSARSGPVPNAPDAGPSRRRAEPEEDGKDVDVRVDVTLEEASSGCLKPIVSMSGEKRPCVPCRGSGCRPGTRSAPCASCSGRGVRPDFNLSRPVEDRACPACRGRGHHPLRPCPVCRGDGNVRSEREIKMRIPAGIEDGQKLRLAGQGEPGVGRPPGDLFVTVKVVQHELFLRKGQDLYIEHRIPLTVALRGGPVDVPTLGGPPFPMAVPAGGVESGKTVVAVRGAGLTSPSRKMRGDMYVTVHVDVPKVRTARAAKLLEELAKELEKWRT